MSSNSYASSCPVQKEFAALLYMDKNQLVDAYCGVYFYDKDTFELTGMIPQCTDYSQNIRNILKKDFSVLKEIDCTNSWQKKENLLAIAYKESRDEEERVERLKTETTMLLKLPQLLVRTGLPETRVKLIMQEFDVFNHLMVTGINRYIRDTYIPYAINYIVKGCDDIYCSANPTTKTPEELNAILEESSEDFTDIEAQQADFDPFFLDYVKGIRDSDIDSFNERMMNLGSFSEEIYQRNLMTSLKFLKKKKEENLEPYAQSERWYFLEDNQTNMNLIYKENIEECLVTGQFTVLTNGTTKNFKIIKSNCRKEGSSEFTKNNYFNKISKDPYLKYMKGFKFRKNTKRDPQFIYEYTHKFSFRKES